MLRMGLAQGQAMPDVALEVFQEVAVEALDHVDRFRPDGQPMAWLLGITVKMITGLVHPTAGTIRILG